MGLTMMKTPFGNSVPCYDLERTICDLTRRRNKMGTDQFLCKRNESDQPGQTISGGVAMSNAMSMNARIRNIAKQKNTLFLTK